MKNRHSNETQRGRWGCGWDLSWLLQSAAFGLVFEGGASGEGRDGRQAAQKDDEALLSLKTKRWDRKMEMHWDIFSLIPCPPWGFIRTHGLEAAIGLIVNPSQAVKAEVL